MNGTNLSWDEVINAPRARREDGTLKGQGWLGMLNRPGGGVSTELSFDFTTPQGKILAPLLVPTLSPQEIQHLLAGGRPTPEIFQKAQEHAIRQVQQKNSPFVGEKFK